MSLHLAVPQGAVTLPDDYMELSSDHGMHAGTEADIDIDIDITSDGMVNQDDDYIIEDAKSEINDTDTWPTEPMQDAIMHEQESVQGMDEDVDIQVDTIEDIQERTPVAGYPSGADHQLPDVEIAEIDANEISPAMARLVSAEGESSFVSSHTVVAEPVDQDLDISDTTTLQHIEGQQVAGATELATQDPELAEGNPQQSQHEPPGSPLPLHPVTLHYGDEEMSLFPPRKNEGSETYFLQNASLAYASMTDVFRAMRLVLAQTIPEGDELEVAIESLGLYLNEDSISTQSLTLSQILDLHVQLNRHDGIENPEPLFMKLTTRTGITSVIKELSTAVAEGKGFSQLPDWEENEIPEDEEEDLTNDEVAADQDEEQYALEEHVDESREEDNLEENASNHGSAAVVPNHIGLTEPEAKSEAPDTSTVDQTVTQHEEALNFDALATTDETTASSHQEPKSTHADERREDDEGKEAVEEEQLDINEFEDAEEEEEDIIDYDEDEDEQAGEDDHARSALPVDGVTTADNGMTGSFITEDSKHEICYCAACDDLSLTEPNLDDLEQETSNEAATPALPQTGLPNDREALNEKGAALLEDEEEHDENPANEETWEASDDGRYDDDLEPAESEENPPAEHVTGPADEAEETSGAELTTEHTTEAHPHQNGDHGPEFDDAARNDANFLIEEEPQPGGEGISTPHVPPPVEDEDQISYDTDEDEAYVAVDAPENAGLEAGEIDEEADEDFFNGDEVEDDKLSVPTATSTSVEVGAKTVVVEAASSVAIEHLSPATERNGSASESQPSAGKRPRAEDDERIDFSSPSQRQYFLFTMIAEVDANMATTEIKRVRST
ncbi:MAG: hypothetical protein M1823_001351 [Watsoniomyces obsoletus]|nr:MAG: hypothetical protein M1823_001351 [Watsoniomyces obsoletus]